MKHNIILFALLLCTLNLQAQQPGSIEALLSTIEQNNLELKALRHSHKAELIDMKAENSVSGPSVEFSPFYKRGLHSLAESELIISEEFDFPTHYRDRSRQTRLQEDVLNNQYNAKRRELLLEAELLALDAIRINQTRQLVQEQLNTSDSILLILEKHLSNGDATALDVNRTKIQHSELQRSLITTESELTKLFEQLRILNGGQPVEVNLSQFPNYKLDNDFDSFAQLALQNNSSVQIAQAEVKMSEHLSKMSRRQWLPSLTVGYRMNTSMGEAVSGMLVGASFPLFSAASKKKAANERLASAQLTLQQEEETTIQQLRSIYNELRSIDKIIGLNDTVVLQSTLTLLDKSFEQKQITYHTYISEKAEIYAKLNDLVELRYQRARILASLISLNS